MTKSGIILLIVGLAVGIGIGFGITSASLSEAPSEMQSPMSIGDRFLVTQGDFTGLPMTLDEAEGQGYVTLSPCVPVMGIHAAKIVGGIPQDPILLFDNKGELIGAELESMTEQPYPPWEHRPEGHPDMEFEHWTLHMYIKDPVGAC